MLERGPGGRGLCRWCKQEVAPPRRTFCSEPCVRQWRIRSDPGYVRELLARRDRGVCAACGVNAERLRHEAMKKRQRLVRAGALPARSRSVPLRGLDVPLGRSLWEADHVVPVVEGGGECDLENFRTLCLWCHRRVTAALRARRRGVGRGHPNDLARPGPAAGADGDCSDGHA